MMTESTGARLCPNCANTIDENAEKCRYCKAEFASESVPRWLNRRAPAAEPRPTAQSRRKSIISAKFIWPAATFILLLIAFFLGGYLQRSELGLTSQAYSKQLQTKDQLLETQEAQLTGLRQQLSENTKQLAALQAKLEDSEKRISATQRQLASRERAQPLPASRAAAVSRSSAESPRSYAGPGPSSRRSDSGVYETVRETAVYENPSAGAQIVSQIGGGTRINVVSSAGDWLEVRSRHGNPPGYIRSADARMLGRAN